MQNNVAGKTGYHSHGGLWLPEDLGVGDIIKCNMMTKHKDNDEAEMCRRNVLVLGLQVDPKTLEYTAIHVARFSYTRTYCTDHDNFLISRAMLRHGLVTGLADQCVMKIDRTDFVPLKTDHFYGDVYDIERVGKVSPMLFAEIAQSLEMGSKLPDRTYSRFSANKNQWYLPGMHLAGDDIASPHFKYKFTDLSDIDLARIQVDYATRKDPNKLEADYVTKCLASIERAHHELMRQRSMSGQHKKGLHVHPIRAKLDFSGAGQAETLLASTDEAINEISPEESFLTLLPHTDKAAIEGLRALGVHFNKQKEAEESYFRLQLPAHMWQGRYLMMRVNDLLDHENDDLAFRPCAVWKMYKDRETGAIAGLELHPVTRGAHKTFNYKMQVYPMSTQSHRASFLVADCIVRVPMEERYFHENPGQFFFELPPDKLERFKDRRNHAMNSGQKIHTYGLQEVPENWEEVPLDPAPSLQQLTKWNQSGKIRFDGNATNNVRNRQRGAAPA